MDRRGGEGRTREGRGRGLKGEGEGRKGKGEGSEGIGEGEGGGRGRRMGIAHPFGLKVALVNFGESTTSANRVR